MNTLEFIIIWLIGWCWCLWRFENIIGEQYDADGERRTIRASTHIWMSFFAWWLVLGVRLLGAVVSVLFGKDKP